MVVMIDAEALKHVLRLAKAMEKRGKAIY